MKTLFNRFLLFFGRTRTRIQAQGGVRYRIEYKILFGREYILHKTVPPIRFTAEGAELPFDLFLS